jgi:hypothetical protein
MKIEQSVSEVNIQSCTFLPESGDELQSPMIIEEKPAITRCRPKRPYVDPAKLELIERQKMLLKKQQANELACGYQKMN